MTHQMNVTLSALAAFIVLLMLVSACGVPSTAVQEPPEADPPTETPVTHEPVSGLLLSEWAKVEAALGISPDEGSVTVQELGLGYDAAGAVTSLHLQFIAAGGEEAAQAFYSVWRHPGEIEYESYSRPVSDVDGRAGVPLLELMRLVDNAGLTNLAPSAGEYAQLELSVEVHQGAVLRSDANHIVYLLGDGGIEQVNSQAVVTGGLQVVVHTYPVGDTSGITDPDNNRTFLVTPLTEHWRFADVADAPVATGEEWLDTKLVDVDGDGDDETLYLVGAWSQEGLLAPAKRRLVVIDGDRSDAYQVPHSDGVYGTSLRVRDLTGDGRPELLFYEYAGGSSGTIDLNVFSLTQSGLIPLFLAADNWEADDLSCSFTSAIDVELTLGDDDVSWSFRLVVDSGLEHEKGARFVPGLDPFSKYDLVDLDADGSVELVAYQLVSGTVHVEALGNLARVFSWDGSGFTESEVRFYRYNAGWGLERVWPDGG